MSDDSAGLAGRCLELSENIQRSGFIHTLNAVPRGAVRGAERHRINATQRTTSGVEEPADRH